MNKVDNTQRTSKFIIINIKNRWQRPFIGFIVVFLFNY